MNIETFINQQMRAGMVKPDEQDNTYAIWRNPAENISTVITQVYGNKFKYAIDSSDGQRIGEFIYDGTDNSVPDELLDGLAMANNTGVFTL